MMKIDLLTPESYQEMPWKNGKGSTTEIAIYPYGSTLAKGDFYWRLSSAEIAQEGPFSPIPGYDRHLAIIEGPGVDLTFSDGVEALNPGEVLNFRGNQPVYSLLRGKPVKDLGLMIRHDWGSAQFEVFRRCPDQIELGYGTHLVYLIEGTLNIQSAHQRSMEIVKAETVKFENYDSRTPVLFSLTGSEETQFALIQILAKGS